MYRALSALIVTLALATPALAQDEPPPLDTSKPIAEQATTQAVWFGQTTWGKVLIVLIVGLTALRIYTAWRLRLERAQQGDVVEGPGRSYAERNLQKLIAHGQFEQAAELVLKLGKNGSGPAEDRLRELEAAELYLRAGRNILAAEVFVRRGRFLRGAEAYERAGRHPQAAELFERAGAYERAERCYLEAQNKPAIATMWAEAGDHEKAAEYFTEICRPREAAEHLEKMGRKADAVGAYIDAHALIVSAASREKAHGFEDAEAKDVLGRILALYDELGEADRYRYAGFVAKHAGADIAARPPRKPTKRRRRTIGHQTPSPIGA